VALEQQDERQAAGADGQRDAVGVPGGNALDQSDGLVGQGVTLDGETEHLGQLPGQHREGDGVQEADADRLGQQVGHQAQAGEADQQRAGPREQRQRAGQGDGVGRVARRQGHDQRGNHRRHRGVRAQHHDAAGSEHGVGDQGKDGGVQPVDCRQARSLGIAHADRHQDRGEHQTRHQVVDEPAAPVVQQRGEPWQPGHPVHQAFSSRISSRVRAARLQWSSTASCMK
jgi:hypothetical protein